MHSVSYLTASQKGEGVFDTLLNVAKKSGQFITKASDIWSSDLATGAKNLFPSEQGSNRNYPGEKHAVLRKPGSNAFFIANYMGPSTQVIKRLKAQSKPRTASDKSAMVHDILYTLAESTDDIRAADRRMIDKLEDIKKSKGDSAFNIAQGQKLIQAKVALEDLGLLKKDRFSKMQGKNLPAKDKDLLQKELKKLEQEGYGNVGDEVKANVIKQYLKNPASKAAIPPAVSLSSIKGIKGKKKGSGVLTTGTKGGGAMATGSGVLTTGTKGKGAMVKGYGVVTVGRGLSDDVVKAVSEEILPRVFKEIGKPLDNKLLKSIRSAAKVSSNVEDFVKNAAHIATHGSLYLHAPKQTGSGCEMSEEMIEMAGSGSLKDFIADIGEKYNEKADKLALNLARFVGKALKKMLANRSNKMSGSGFFGDVGNFFKDFGEGFSSGWNSTLALFNKVPGLNLITKIVPLLPGDKYILEFQSFKLKPNKKPKSWSDFAKNVIESAPKIAKLVV